LKEAKKLGYKIALSGQKAGSLSIAPAYSLVSLADIIDLPDPNLFIENYSHPMKCEDGVMYPPNWNLWG